MFAAKLSNATHPNPPVHNQKKQGDCYTGDSKNAREIKVIAAVGWIRLTRTAER